MKTCVIFRIREENYALPIEHVREVMRSLAITRLPHAPPFIRGVINLRGEIVPVLDLLYRFSYQPSAYDLESHLVIAHWKDKSLAIIVDEVLNVQSLTSEELVDQPDQLPIYDYLSSLGKNRGDLVLILDLSKLLNFRDLEKWLEAPVAGDGENSLNSQEEEGGGDYVE